MIKLYNTLTKQKEILREFDGALDNKKNYKLILFL